jgi:hypothetical protein
LGAVGGLLIGFIEHTNLQENRFVMSSNPLFNLYLLINPRTAKNLRDSDLREAIEYCRGELCTGKYAPKRTYIPAEKRVVMGDCVMDSKKISGIIITYIACFSLDEHRDVKYFMDEWSGLIA